MRQHFREYVLGSAVLLWLFLALAAVGALVWNRLPQAANSSFEAARIGALLDGLSAPLGEAEAGQRSFLLTGNEGYLNSFTNAESSLNRRLEELTRLAQGDDLLHADVQELRGQVVAKMSGLKDELNLRRSRSPGAATASVDGARDREATERIQKVMSGLREHGVATLAGRRAAVGVELARLRIWGVVLAGLGLFAGWWAFYLIRAVRRQEETNVRLLDAKLRAEKAAAETSSFLANISHEIRTPMNAILGFSELLEGEPLRPRQAQFVRSIRESGKSLLQLVSDVLDLSKLEAGKLELKFEPTDVREICNFLQTMFAQQAAAKSLRLLFEPDGVPPSLLLDRLRLRQVLVNLVGNAIKFTGQGQVLIRLEWLPEPGHPGRGTLLVRVQDTGPGIPLEKQEEIFKPFVQSAFSAGAENEGTGLGLSIVQRLAAIMGGAVTLSSSPGKGSSFLLRFPEVEVSTHPPVSDVLDVPEAPDFNDFEPAIVLVVDDNESNRALVGSIFAGTHHKIRLAASGPDALADLARLKPDLVLLDIRMPSMDGLAVLAAIRKVGSLDQLPVIAMSASSLRSDESNLRNRFRGYIRKPFSRQVLYQELSLVLRRTPPKAGSTPRGTPEPAPPTSRGSARRTDDWNLLAAELRKLEISEWPGLCESLAINQTHAFARKLETLAQLRQCHPLADYAEMLGTHAGSYRVRDLERQLAEFPALVSIIEKNSTTTPDA